MVVGAGPAGSAAAAALASRGRRVLLLEKDRLPRRKVCGELLSGRARPSLERLGVRPDVEAIAAAVRRGSFHLASGRSLPFALPSPAIGISRFALDEILARRAAALGAELRCGARVLGIAADGDGVRVTWAGSAGCEPGQAEAPVAVGAWGRWDALDRVLERRFGRERARYLGWSLDYRRDRTASAADRPDFRSNALACDEVGLYLFPGGYCGLSPVEGGRVHLAGVISERLRRRIDPGWPAVVAHARDANPALDRHLATLSEDGESLGTGPVYFTRKPPSSAGAILAGDAAGVLDPFSGEGQATALASGLLAGDVVARALAGETPMASVAADYADAWQGLFARRFAWSSAFRALVLHPRIAGVAARLAGKRLAALAVRKLAGS